MVRPSQPCLASASYASRGGRGGFDPAERIIDRLRRSRTLALLIGEDPAFVRTVAQLPAIAARLRAEEPRVAAVLDEAGEAMREEIVASGYVLDTLKAALWAVLTSDSFEDALIAAVNLGDDADTVGAVAGSPC